MTTLTQSAMMEKHHEEEAANNRVFGFWFYLMTDCLIFGTFFAVYVVLLNNTTNGHDAKSLFDLSNAFIETMALLTSSLTCGLAMISLRKENISGTILWLFITLFLGAIFLTLEIEEFAEFISIGATPQSSGFLSGFFGLVGLHGLHLSLGMVWMIIMMIQLIVKGPNLAVKNRMRYFSLYWHFLDVIWICLFTVVYLMGVLI